MAAQGIGRDAGEVVTRNPSLIATDCPSAASMRRLVGLRSLSSTATKERVPHDEVAGMLMQCRERGTSATAEAMPVISSIDDAYRVQGAMLSVESSLGAVTGFKMGACAAAPQQALGLSDPFRAPLFSETFRSSPATAPFAGLAVVEAEVGFVLGHSLPPRDGGAAYSEEEVWAAVQRVHATIELCGTRCTFEGATPLQKIADGGPSLPAHPIFATQLFRRRSLPRRARPAARMPGRTHARTHSTPPPTPPQHAPTPPITHARHARHPPTRTQAST